MKAPLFLLLNLSICFARAQALSSQRWMIGATPTQVRSQLLGSPGRRLDKDSGFSKTWRFVLYINADTTEVIDVSFFGEACQEYKVTLAGMHRADLDKRYEDIQNLGPNDWCDEDKSGKVYVHREYNGAWTELTIGRNRVQ